MLADESDIEVELERKELIELLDRAMALLPPETRAVLVKRYVEESPLQEVASELGVNISTVAMRLQRGKLALRRVLTTDLRRETALYTPQTLASSSEQWETTPLWCYLCGQHRLLGIRKSEEGKLFLKCPGCNRNSGEAHRDMSERWQNRAPQCRTGTGSPRHEPERSPCLGRHRP